MFAFNFLDKAIVIYYDGCFFFLDTDNIVFMVVYSLINNVKSHGGFN